MQVSHCSASFLVPLFLFAIVIKLICTMPPCCVAIQANSCLSGQKNRIGHVNGSENWSYRISNRSTRVKKFGSGFWFKPKGENRSCCVKEDERDGHLVFDVTTFHHQNIQGLALITLYQVFLGFFLLFGFMCSERVIRLTFHCKYAAEVFHIFICVVPRCQHSSLQSNN